MAERNLFQMSYKNVHMHTLVGCMGRIIERDARETQSRIWLWKDAHRVFQEESESNNKLCFINFFFHQIPNHYHSQTMHT